MKIVKIENNKIYSTSTLCEKTDIFEIVEKIPVRFFVWNIGENMGTHEYIPVCEDLHPEDKDNYEINTATLKAVKVTPDEWKKLDKAASWGAWFRKNNWKLKIIMEQFGWTRKFLYHKILVELSDIYDLELEEKFYVQRFGYRPEYKLDLLDGSKSLARLATGYINYLLTEEGDY